VNATLPAADSTLKAQGRPHEFSIYSGAGTRLPASAGGAAGANLTATRQAWPATVAWFRRHLGS
jgi:dienelactone hydrolase